MKSLLLWICFALLIAIHTIDMELTRVFIGDQWELETFPPMKYCIKQFGIYNSLWISRIIMYSLFLFYLLNNKNLKLQKVMIISTILYWTAMIGWLDIFDFPPFNNYPFNGV